MLVYLLIIPELLTRHPAHEVVPERHLHTVQTRDRPLLKDHIGLARLNLALLDELVILILVASVMYNVEAHAVEKQREQFG